MSSMTRGCGTAQPSRSPEGNDPCLTVADMDLYGWPDITRARFHPVQKG
ncbi:hypothetical protein DESPIG_01385 [Desulfovibrio piger ATCC 29098]|uniref:Uncharacterized protein n=1 Tax=Desulfovibrio piger ATCC 29098 TaxID=411464 RepID=B6WTH9_9BACT|nr:hypothetical protein DESPIG_01385 [Desulfovibrio piger ATCC 29098]